jgi:hypothetical protein
MRLPKEIVKLGGPLLGCTRSRLTLTAGRQFSHTFEDSAADLELIGRQLLLPVGDKGGSFVSTRARTF